MSSEKDREFERSMKEFIQLLKKMVKQLPSQGGVNPPSIPWGETDGKGMQMNIFFLSFLPFSQEDFDDLEEMCDHYFNREDDNEELTAELSVSDLEFLKQHGIRF